MVFGRKRFTERNHIAVCNIASDYHLSLSLSFSLLRWYFETLLRTVYREVKLCFRSLNIYSLQRHYIVARFLRWNCPSKNGDENSTLNNIDDLARRGKKTRVVDGERLRAHPCSLRKFSVNREPSWCHREKRSLLLITRTYMHARRALFVESNTNKKREEIVIERERTRDR